MKKKSGNIYLPAILFLALMFQSCHNSETEHHAHYLPKDMPDEEKMEQLITSPNKLVLSRQKTVKLSVQSKEQSLKIPGFIDFDRTRYETVSARFGGRIEKLYVNYDFQFVKKDEKVLELYSQELNTIQEQHLLLLESQGDTTLLELSRKKLKLLGITDFQISEIEKNKTFTQTVTIYCPADGYVFFNTETNSFANDNSTEQNAMTNMNMPTKNYSGKTFGFSPSQIREGIYINKGETLFRVNDLLKVWVIASVTSDYYSVIKENTQVKIISELFPEFQFEGSVSLVEQTFEENKQRFVRIRIALPNDQINLKINSLVTAEIHISSSDNFEIPSSAVNLNGLSAVVWVKTGVTKNGAGVFQLRKITIGAVANGMTTVLRGLSLNEEVAEHAGFLSDSETFLNDK